MQLDTPVIWAVFSSNIKLDKCVNQNECQDQSSAKGLYALLEDQIDEAAAISSTCVWVHNHKGMGCDVQIEDARV